MLVRFVFVAVERCGGHADAVALQFGRGRFECGRPATGEHDVARAARDQFFDERARQVRGSSEYERAVVAAGCVTHPAESYCRTGFTSAIKSDQSLAKLSSSFQSVRMPNLSIQPMSRSTSSP